MLSLKAICELLSSLQDEVDDAISCIRCHDDTGLFPPDYPVGNWEEDCLALDDVDRRLQQTRQQLEELPEEACTGEEYDRAWDLYDIMDEDISQTRLEWGC